MDFNYQNVKISSKFLKILEQYNLSGQASTSGAAPGAVAGANPGVVTPGATVNPALQKAQKNAADAAKKVGDEARRQAQMDLNTFQQQLKAASAGVNSPDPAIKAQSRAAVGELNARIQSAQSVLKAPKV
jgi:hypothetical protein